MSLELIGYIGTALVVAAYVPQIYHLIKHTHCACGISILSWILWLIAVLLLLVYAILLQDLVFILVQSINLIAIITIMVLSRTISKKREVC